MRYQADGGMQTWDVCIQIGIKIDGRRERGSDRGADSRGEKGTVNR